MPIKIQKPCKYPGCGALTREGVCDNHKQNYKRPQREFKNYYGRGWQKVRSLHLTLEPWCNDCLKNNIYSIATDVHHIQKHSGDMFLFVTSPLMSLCHSCHAKRTKAGE